MADTTLMILQLSLLENDLLFIISTCFILPPFWRCTLSATKEAAVVDFLSFRFKPQRYVFFDTVKGKNHVFAVKKQCGRFYFFCIFAG
jgi:hypothetical protein